MRPVILLLVALLIFFVEIAQGDELPKRKPGLWELSWYSDEVTPTQSPIEPRIVKMCIDTKTDEKLAAAYDPCDPPVFLMFYAPQFTKEVVCEATIDAHLKMVSRSRITFTSDMAYRIEVKTRFEPSLKHEGEISGGREGKWVKACPSDMRPGDLTIEGLPKDNVFEELAKPHQ